MSKSDKILTFAGKGKVILAVFGPFHTKNKKRYMNLLCTTYSVNMRCNIFSSIEMAKNLKICLVLSIKMSEVMMYTTMYTARKYILTTFMVS